MSTVEPPNYGTPPPPPPGGQPPYGAPGGAGGPKNSGKALTSLITGIVSLPAVCCWPLSVVLAIVSIVFGILGRKEIAASGGGLKGSGMALAGIICSAVAVILIVVVLVLAATGAIDTNFEYTTS